VSRRLKVSAAQLGAIHRADSRKSVVKAAGRDAEGGRFARLEVRGVSPSWRSPPSFRAGGWKTQEEVDKYFEAQMPSPETLPLFEAGALQGHRLLTWAMRN